jgi:hypothetical protein
LLHLGTELVGAVVTVFLFDQFIERREKTEAEKARLIAEMGSSVRDVAVSAVEKLRRRGWLLDGSLQGAKLLGANLGKADLGKANLGGAILYAANLSGAILLATNLSGADLGKADLGGAILFETDLSGANLRETKLLGTDLRGVNLRGADLLKAIYDDGTIWPEGFDPNGAGAWLWEDFIVDDGPGKRFD